LVLDRDSFNLLLGPLDEIQKRSEERVANRDDPSRGPSKLNSKRPPIAKSKLNPNLQVADLKKVGILGCGGFGVVELYSHKTEANKAYAVKSLSKGYIVANSMEDSVMNEKDILMMADSPFVIQLYGTWNSPQMLHFVMELALGGELYATYNRKSLHGSEEHAKFYTAGMLCSFEHLHELHIIYRDLKPENILMNEAGFVKLTDMGLAKYVIGMAYTVCGTPDYFAPEVIASSGYTNAVDWWALGVLIFELMCGCSPFEAADPMKTYQKIRRGIDKVKFPPGCQGTCKDLVMKLMEPDPSARLPMRSGGTKNITAHKWYDKFKWADYRKGTVKPPYAPKVKSKTDLSNFSVSPEDMPETVTYKDDGSGWDAEFATMKCPAGFK